MWNWLQCVDPKLTHSKKTRCVNFGSTHCRCFLNPYRESMLKKVDYMIPADLLPWICVLRLFHQWNNRWITAKIWKQVRIASFYTVGEVKDWSVWSKTTLITGGVGGTGVDLSSWKTGTFLMSLALSVPIFSVSGAWFTTSPLYLLIKFSFD